MPLRWLREQSHTQEYAQPLEPDLVNTNVGSADLPLRFPMFVYFLNMRKHMPGTTPLSPITLLPLLEITAATNTNNNTEKQSLLPEKNIHKRRLLQLTNGAIIILQIPYGFYIAPLINNSINTLFNTNPLSNTITVVLVAAELTRDALRLNPAEAIEWALQKKNEKEIKYPKTLIAIYIISAITFSIDGIKDLIPMLNTGNTTIAKIVVGILGIPFVILPYEFYDYVIYGDRLLEHYNGFPRFFTAAAWKTFIQEPITTLETIIILLLTICNKIISSNGALVQLWNTTQSTVPHAILHINTMLTSLTTLFSRSLSTIRLHHNDDYKKLTAIELQNSKLNTWEICNTILQAGLRAFSIFMLCKKSSLWLACPVGTLSFALKARSHYHTQLLNHALQEKKKRELVEKKNNEAITKEDLFDKLIQQYETPNLEKSSTVLNGLVCISRFCLYYSVAALLLSSFGFVLNDWDLFYGIMLIIIPILEGDVNVACEDLKKTITGVQAKYTIEEKLPPNSTDWRAWRLFSVFCCKSRKQLCEEISEESLEDCLETVASSAITSTANNNTPCLIM